MTLTGTFFLQVTGSTSIQAADSTAINGSITPTDKRYCGTSNLEAKWKLWFRNCWDFILIHNVDFLHSGSSLCRIGFLGLGLMGSGIVSNLLKMGHVVTVWNRTAEKVLSCNSWWKLQKPVKPILMFSESRCIDLCISSLTTIRT